MRLRNKIILSILLVLVVLLLTNCELVVYGIKQGKGQLEMVRNAVPIKDLLNDPEYPDSLKSKLKIIQEVREFAINNLKLHDSPNYQAVYDLKGRATAYVVQGCEKYRVKKYVWKFPVVGKLPYKGYFNEDEAKVEAKKLEDKGYDVRIVNPSGWSTMGWFKDPVLSSMLKRDEAFLAELIIHELTHSTIFVKNDSELNENIADYVGENGAKCYLSYKYGDTSAVLQKYKDVIDDNEKLATYFLVSAKNLDSLYCTDQFKSLTDSIKDFKKHEYIQNIICGVDSLNFKAISIPKLKNARLKNINNTFFTSYMTYYNRKDSLRLQCKTDFDSDFMKQLSWLKEKYGK